MNPQYLGGFSINSFLFSLICFYFSFICWRSDLLFLVQILLSLVQLSSTHLLTALVGLIQPLPQTTALIRCSYHWATSVCCDRCLLRLRWVRTWPKGISNCATESMENQLQERRLKTTNFIRCKKRWEWRMRGAGIVLEIACIKLASWNKSFH